MNIMYSVFSFQTGGIEKLLVDIVNNWNSKEDNLFLCVINDDYNENLLNEIKQENVQIILLKKPKGREKWRFLLQYLKIVRKNRIDILHCQSGDILLYSILNKLLNPKIKLFHTIHDTNIYMNYSKWIILIDKYITKNVISISHAVTKDIIQQGIRIQKVKLIYNGIDLKKFTFKENFKSGNMTKIGCVARIMPQKKGQDVLIKAIELVKENHPDIICYFAGTHPKEHPEFLNQLLGIVQEKGLESHIKFLGNIDDIPSFLKEIDIFVLPSFNEGFGISLIEAMASGLPVITTNIDGPREITQKGEYGRLFNPGDFKQLSEEIGYIIDNPEKLNLKNTYKYIKQEYSIENVVCKLRDLYK